MNKILTLNVGFGTALSQKLQAPLSEVDNLALIIFLGLVLLGLDLLVRDLLDHVDNVI